MKFEGYNGQLTVDGDAIVLTREGMAARVAYGKDVPPRRIPLAAVSGARLKPATRLKNGHIQLLIGGVDGGEPTSVADHPDVVIFTWAKRAQFDELSQLLLRAAETNLAHGDPASVTADPGQAGRLQRKIDEAHAGRSQEWAAAGILFEGMSHESGRNAVVRLYGDRLERVKAAKFTAISQANQDVEMTPVKSISSVQASKDGVLFTKVTVYASGNNIEFRFGHTEAEQFRAALQGLILAGPSLAAAPAAATPQALSLPEQLRQLAALRDDGILTEEEFTAQKAKLLA